MKLLLLYVDPYMSNFEGKKLHKMKEAIDMKVSLDEIRYAKKIESVTRFQILGKVVWERGPF